MFCKNNQSTHSRVKRNRRDRRTFLKTNGTDELFEDRRDRRTEFPFSFIPFFIFYISREVRNQRRTQAHLRPSSISQATFLPPYGGGTGWGSLFNHELFPALYIYPLGKLETRTLKLGTVYDSSAREVVNGSIGYGLG